MNLWSSGDLESNPGGSAPSGLESPIGIRARGWVCSDEVETERFSSPTFRDDACHYHLFRDGPGFKEFATRTSAQTRRVVDETAR